MPASKPKLPVKAPSKAPGALQGEPKAPNRDVMPITAGKEPQWRLEAVETDYLVAELVRRGYKGFSKGTK